MASGISIPRFLVVPDKANKISFIYCSGRFFSVKKQYAENEELDEK